MVASNWYPRVAGAAARIHSAAAGHASPEASAYRGRTPPTSSAKALALERRHGARSAGPSRGRRRVAAPAAA
jgi:hypothetical protein